MEIKDLILLMWRNIRYIILGLVLGAGIGIAIAQIQSPVYEATAKVFVSRTRQQGSSDMLSSLSDEQLLAINLQLAKSQPVLNEVSSQLGSKVDADNIQAGAIPNTLIIQIKVQDNDPQRAAAIANLIVQILIQQNEALLSGQYTGFETAINGQLDQVQKQIEGLQTQISEINNAGIQEQLTQVNQQIEQLKTDASSLEKEIGSFPLVLTPINRISLAEKQGQLDQLKSLMILYQQIQTNLTYVGKPGQGGTSPENPQLATLQSVLGIYQQINVTLINNRENVRLARTQSRQNVLQIVSATPPKNPVRPMPALYFLLGGVVGLTLAATAILALDHFDDSLKSASQVEKSLDLSILGLVFESKQSENGLVTVHDPLSAEAESFRTLGANLEIIGAKKSIHSLVVVNAEPTDTQTTIAANLAVINAQQGKQVILLDGNIKRPHLHNLFEMENQKGFAELISGKVDIKSACHPVKDVDGLTLIASGVAEKDSTMWLDSKKWEQLLSELQSQADLVIVDSPPADAADTQILTSKVNSTLLVVQSGHTRIDSAQATLKRFKLADVMVAGVVLNHKIQYRRINPQFLAWLKIKTKSKKAGEVDGEVETPAISASNIP